MHTRAEGTEPNRATPRVSARRSGWFGVAAFIGILTGCASGGPATDRAAHHAAPASGSVVAVARAMLGQPYQYGGDSPGGFDCSGLVAYAHEQAGHNAPRTVALQLDAVERVPRSELQPGDLVFYELDDKPAHVGIYAGDNRFIHAPSSGGVVRETRMGRDYWQRRFLAAGRL